VVAVKLFVSEQNENTDGQRKQRKVFESGPGSAADKVKHFDDEIVFKKHFSVVHFTERQSK
jgi:hypothetical protein